VSPAPPVGGHHVGMCRWLAYSGSPIRLEELLYRPRYSLIDQSLHSRLGVETTNGDGFGIGWYVPGAPEPVLFRGVGPAWNDPNLREIARSTTSPLFVAHIRASTGTAVQQTNCHPFRYRNWLWAHNGSIREFHRLKRDLVLAVDPELYPAMTGSTDSEVMFYLALTYGLRDRPIAAVERMAGLVESVARAYGVPDPLQMTVATTDGDRTWCVRYSSEGRSRSLFYSTEMSALQRLYPEQESLRGLSEETRLVVSEPLGELAGAWQEVPESSYGVIQKGDDELGRFEPAMP
jgi:predicted glutamine amidotransferase